SRCKRASTTIKPPSQASVHPMINLINHRAFGIEAGVNGPAAGIERIQFNRWKIRPSDEARPPDLPIRLMVRLAAGICRRPQAYDVPAGFATSPFRPHSEIRLDDHRQTRLESPRQARPRKPDQDIAPQGVRAR